MLQTAFTLTLTQFARSLSLPERLQHAPARNLALEALRLRNTTLDALFYDVKVISPDEVFYISDSLAAEGSIMIVPPSGAGSLTLCETLEEFVLRGGEDVHSLTVAGVGGSALGAAAFARNVADAVGAPVAVVVSGYGLADIVNEVFGGGFFFGHLKGLRPVFERLDDLAGRTRFGVADTGDHNSPSANSLDTRCVRALLSDPRLSFRLLAGHSKGNLVLAAALHDIAKQDPESATRLAQGMRIVTFGARIAMPPVFENVSDVIGEWDWFGEMNSRSYIAADARVRHAWHHTNTDLAGHLPVTKTLGDLLADTASPSPPGEKAAESVAPVVTAVPELPNAATERVPAPTPADKPAVKVTSVAAAAPEPQRAKLEAEATPAAPPAAATVATPAPPKPARKSRGTKAERSDVTESVLSKVSALRAARKGRPGPTKRH